MKDKIVNHPTKLRVKNSSIHGYGGFVTEDIIVGQVLEEAVVPTDTIHAVYEYYGERTYNTSADIMARYRFSGPRSKHGNSEFYVCPTGFAMLYNHNDDPNVVWEHDCENRLIVFRAIRPIKKGEECFINYGYSPSPENEDSNLTV